MKERRKRPDKGRGPVKLETRRPPAKPKVNREPAAKRPPPDLDLLMALRAWAGGRGERATDEALSAGGGQQRFRLRGGLDRIFRHYARLTWLLGEQDIQPTTELIWAAGQVVLNNAPLEDVAKAIAVTTRDIARLAGVLGRMSGAGIDVPSMPDHVRLECPPSLFPVFQAAFGSRATAELTALNLPGPLDLRVNTLKATPDAVVAALAAGDMLVSPTPYAPLALRARARPDLAATKAFQDGLFEMQDEGSQLVAALTGAAPGQQVLDMCAGAGGKGMALAAAMENRGHLVAADTSARRLLRAKLRFKRAGVENAERIALTGTDEDPFLRRRANWFDRVLVDAPCSGSGAWRRHPETKWRGDLKLDELKALQDAILRRAAKLTKRGGRVIFATCSLLPSENEARVEAFLAAHQNFRLLEAAAVWAESQKQQWPCADRQFLKLTPALHGTDGFFAAVFERVS